MAITKHAIQWEESSGDSGEESDAASEYTVERILAERLGEDGTIRYLVKWLTYKDEECTWEPADSFLNPLTISEWNEASKRGDFLPPDEVKRIEGLMADFAAHHNQTSEEADAVSKADKDEDANPRDKKRRKLVHGSRPRSESVSPIRKIITTAPKSKPPNPLSSPPKKHSTLVGRSNTHPQSHEAMLIPTFKSHYDLNQAVATATKAPRATVPSSNATLSSSRAGPASHAVRTPRPPDQFRSLSHMNNVRKKALRVEAAPQMTNLINPSQLPQNEPAHNLPPTAAPKAPDSPLFFDDKSASTEPVSPLRRSTGPPNILSPKDNIQSFPKHQLFDNHKPDQSTPQTILTRRTGREFKKWDEVVVQLSLGDHDLGDVKLVGLPDWVRKLLIRLKVGNDLKLHFPQDQVYDRSLFESISAGWAWPRTHDAVQGEVQPFEDTRTACDGLATYFEQHNSGAVWAHPDPENNVALILHSSASPKWRRPQYLQLPGGSSRRLLLGVRNRCERDEIPPPFPPQLLQPAILASIGGPSVRTAHDVPRAPTPTTLRSVSPIRHVPAAVAPSVLIVATAPPPPPRMPSMPSSKTPTTKSISVLPEAEDHVLESVATRSKPHTKELQKVADWKCDLNPRALIKANNQKDGFAFVYIAFGAIFPEQAQAVKVWLAETTITRDRFIFVEDTAIYTEWQDFCDTRRTKHGFVFFSQEDPTFCKLPDLGTKLGAKGDELRCFSLRWSHDPNSKEKPLYNKTVIFPSGTVMLLSEATMRQPSAALEILSWFEQNSRGKALSWKLMLRPNIRAWLEHRALHAQDQEAGKTYLDILVQIHKLSTVVDVTALGDDLKQFRILESMSTTKAEKRDDFIIGMPVLEHYDSSPTSDSSHEAVARRDEILLRHFVGWSATNVANHRRFMVIDAESARQERDKTIYDNAHHIVFQSAEQFKQSNIEKKTVTAAVTPAAKKAA